MAKNRVERDEEDLVRLYLTDIGQYPLLTKDDEVRLAQEIEAGTEARAVLEADQLPDGSAITSTKKRELRRADRKGERAERTFVQSNLRLVVSIARNQRQAYRFLISSKRNLVLCMSKSLTAKASNFPLCARGGSERPSARGIATRVEQPTSRSAGTPSRVSKKLVPDLNSNLGAQQRLLNSQLKLTYPGTRSPKPSIRSGAPFVVGTS